jgi:hypothetical protein
MPSSPHFTPAVFGFVRISVLLADYPVSLCHMSRDRYETVTHGLAILVPVLELPPVNGKSQEADAWVSVFRAPNRWAEQAVREVNKSDIEGQGRLRQIFHLEELPLVLGVAAMGRAFRKRNADAFRQAFDKARPWWPSAGRFTLGNIESNWSGAQWLYSRLMNKLVQNARLILWRREKGLLMPALYCPDLKTAAFVMAVMDRIRVCPKCNGVFTPKASNVEYCNPAHGGAYRTARSRRNKGPRDLPDAKRKTAKKNARKSSRNLERH